MKPPHRQPKQQLLPNTGVPGLAGRRILVIGGNGFIGCNLVALASRAGANLLVTDLPWTASRAESVRSSLGAGKVAIRLVERIDVPSLKGILDDFRPEIICNLSGITRRDNTPEAWIQCAEGNVVLTTVVLEAAVQMPESSRPAIVMPGSQMEYGRAPMPWTEERTAIPANPYGATKLAASQLLQAAVHTGLIKGSTARLPLVFGPGQMPTMIVPEVIIKAMTQTDIAMTQGLQQRRFVFVADSVRFLLSLGMRLTKGDVCPSLVNAPACPPIAIIDLVRQLLAIMGNPVDLKVGAMPQRSDEILDGWPDTTLAESMGFPSVTPLEEGLDATVRWYQDNPWFAVSLTSSSS